MKSYRIATGLLILALTPLHAQAAIPNPPVLEFPPHPAADGPAPKPRDISVSILNDIIRHELANNQYDNAIKLLSPNTVIENLQQARTIAENFFKHLQSSTDVKKQEGIKAAREAVFARLAEIDMHQGTRSKTDPSRALLLPERRSPSLGAFVSRHSGKLGMGLYQGVDGALQYRETTKKGEGLSSKTAREVHGGFKDSLSFSLDGRNSLSSIARAVRPVTSIGYGLMPWAQEIAASPIGKALPGHHHTFKKQSPLSKGIGLANLATLGINGVYNLSSRKNSSLNAKEAYLLSYLNRRHGIPLEIRKYKKDMSTLAKARWLVRVIGLAGLPALLALFSKGKDATTGIATSPAILVGNLASIADSLMGIFERYRTQRLVKEIKKITPFIEEELKQRPPTAQEKEADREAGGDIDFGSMMPGMMGGNGF
jgi:hypothetical protein